MHKSESEVAQSCLILRDLMDCSLTGSSVHETFQARVLEWGATAFSGLVAKLYSVLLDSINCSTPNSFVLHYLSEFAHIHIY